MFQAKLSPPQPAGLECIDQCTAASMRLMARATKSRAQRLLRVDWAQRWHDFRTLYANPAEEQGVILRAVNRASGKERTMSYLSDLKDKPGTCEGRGKE